MSKLEIALLSVTALVVMTIFLLFAGHKDAPKVTDTAQDIAHFYVFEDPTSSDNLVLVTAQGLLSPAATGVTQFDENTLIESNIDNDVDKVENLVIQSWAMDSADQRFCNIKLNQLVNMVQLRHDSRPVVNSLI